MANDPLDSVTRVVRVLPAARETLATHMAIRCLKLHGPAAPHQAFCMREVDHDGWCSPQRPALTLDPTLFIALIEAAERLRPAEQSRDRALAGILHIDRALRADRETGESTTAPESDPVAIADAIDHLRAQLAQAERRVADATARAHAATAEAHIATKALIDSRIRILSRGRTPTQIHDDDYRVVDALTVLRHLIGKEDGNVTAADLQRVRDEMAEDTFEARMARLRDDDAEKSGG